MLKIIFFMGIGLLLVCSAQGQQPNPSNSKDTQSNVKAQTVSPSNITAPRLLKSVDAKFPQIAREYKMQAVVLVTLRIDVEGRPINVHVNSVDLHGNPPNEKVATAVGQAFEQNAEEAVRQYEFKPSMKDGKPIEVSMSVKVNFRIY